MMEPVSLQFPSYEEARKIQDLIDERRALWLKTTTEALELLTELWPSAKNGEAVYCTQEQWKRLRQVLLALPDLGD